MEEETFAKLFAAGEVPDPVVTDKGAGGGLEPGNARQAAGKPIPSQALDWDVGNAPESWRRQGVSARKLDLLRRGRIAVDCSYDYHGCTQREAFDKLNDDLANSMGRGHTCVELVHGKGGGVLRTSMRGWLGCGVKCVMAYAHRPGNNGSLLVLLG